MGRLKKKPIEDQLETVAEDVLKRNARQLVDAEHTIKYRQPVPVPSIDLGEDDLDGIDEIEEKEEEADEEDDKPKRRAKPTFLEQLNKELSAAGIANEEQLRLRVDRLPLYELDGRTGLTADKAFVRHYDCDIKFITSGEYLNEVATIYGGGMYWFTLRHKTTIRKSWKMKISSPTMAPASTHSVDTPTPAVSTTVAASYPPYPPPPPTPPPRTFKQELKDLVETTRLIDELKGNAPAPAAPTPQPEADPEVALLKMLARDESVMSRLSKGFLSKILGNTPEEKNEWAEIAMEIIKSGQAPQIISATIKSVFSGFSNLIPKGANGTSPQAQNESNESNEGQSENVQPGLNGGPDDPDTQLPPAAPEDQLLTFVLDQCARRVPARVVVDRILRFAKQVNQHAPAQSIDAYLDMFTDVEPAVALEFVKAQGPEGERISALPHALQWTTEVQQLLNQELNSGVEEFEE